MFARKSALSGHMYNVCDKTFALCFKPKSKNLIKFTFKYKFGKKLEKSCNFFVYHKNCNFVKTKL